MEIKLKHHQNGEKFWDPRQDNLYIMYSFSLLILYIQLNILSENNQPELRSG